MRTSLLDVRAMRGADVGSDHNLVRGRIKIQQKTNTRNKQIMKRFELRKLEDAAT